MTQLNAKQIDNLIADTNSTIYTEEVATILLVINLKLTNDTTTANNKLVRDYKVRGISLVLFYERYVFYII